MGVLTETPDCKIYTKKCRLSVNPAFNYVLDIQKLYKEDCLTDLEKIDAALEVLVRNSWNLRLLNPKERAEVMEEIAARFIRTKKRPEVKKNPVPVLDFEEDGDYIYASFMEDYRIDLIDEQGRLPWKKFLYLFNGLSADTKIKQVMQIRQMELRDTMGRMRKRFRRSTN